MEPSRALVLLVATVAMAAAGVGGDIAADQAECMNTLIGLETCLPYVQEQAAAAAPTRECCAGLKNVVQTSPKCLCMLVKDKDDPSLQGFKIDATKALGLPQACKTPADVSMCPKLLNLPRNSKDAQVFEQYAKQMAGAPSAPGGAGSNATGSADAQKSGAVVTRWLGVDIFSAAAPLATPFLLLLG